MVTILDATRGCAHLKSICRILSGQGLASTIVFHRPSGSREVSNILGGTAPGGRSAVSEETDSSAIVRAFLEENPGAAVAYIPCDVEPDQAALCSADCGLVTPLLPVLAELQEGAKKITPNVVGWVAPRTAVEELLAAKPKISEWGLPHLIGVLERSSRCLRWASSPITTLAADGVASCERPLITTRSRVLAVVPHYGCERWLEQCLYSLANQTRPPDNIVVIDDCSPEPPRDIVAQFPDVTLLSAPVNIGPENILHDVIRTLDYDAFLVQDADDWSAADRLEHSLLEAERTGAEVVSTQVIGIVAEQKIILQLHPLDVNRALSKRIAHYVCHGGSLIGRSLAWRIGGFDRALEVTADTDFILRASHLGRIVNMNGFYYYRRLRPGSRTSSDNTGFGSALRKRESDFIYGRARHNVELQRQGVSPEVVAKDRLTPAQFRHVLGPRLQGKR